MRILMAIALAFLAACRPDAPADDQAAEQAMQSVGTADVTGPPAPAQATPPTGPAEASEPPVPEPVRPPATGHDLAIELLIDAYAAEKAACRGGSGSHPLTFRACDRRTVIGNELVRQGFCWGEDNEAEASKYWKPCPGRPGRLQDEQSSYEQEMKGDRFEPAPGVHAEAIRLLTEVLEAERRACEEGPKTDPLTPRACRRQAVVARDLACYRKADGTRWLTCR